MQRKWNWTYNLHLNLQLHDFAKILYCTVEQSYSNQKGAKSSSYRYRARNTGPCPKLSAQNNCSLVKVSDTISGFFWLIGMESCNSEQSILVQRRAVQITKFNITKNYNTSVQHHYCHKLLFYSFAFDVLFLLYLASILLHCIALYCTVCWLCLPEWRINLIMHSCCSNFITMIVKTE